MLVRDCGGIAGALPKENQTLFLIGNSAASALWFWCRLQFQDCSSLFKRPIIANSRYFNSNNNVDNCI